MKNPFVAEYVMESNLLGKTLMFAATASRLTMEQSIAFYSNRRQGMKAADALQRAKSELPDLRARTVTAPVAIKASIPMVIVQGIYAFVRTAGSRISAATANITQKILATAKL